MTVPTAKALCPVCGAAESVEVVTRVALPVLQNVVYSARTEALDSPVAPFALSVCSACGFGFNSRFDPARMVYDERYDNEVPSPAFLCYYREVAKSLADRFLRPGDAVYEVGCGKGTFLEALLDVAPGVRAIGVDPTCKPRESSRLRLTQGEFSPSAVTERPSLVICRHVLEHIQHPIDFLAAIREALEGFGGIPVYVEVPDLSWILEHGAFWDFCYEHCNYFAPSNLALSLQRAGFTVVDAGVSFSQQYQWVVASSVPSSVGAQDDGASLVAAALQYKAAESSGLARARKRALEARGRGSCVLWGMATKGVVFAHLVDPNREVFDGGVDLNPRKQDCFVPGSGHRIHAPEWLTTLPQPVTVFVMNPNYAAEIAALLSEMRVDAVLEVL
ncbi:MAG: class I SAM-dependent methyltransferase [Polyangiaceae bacterium]